jgi:pheromone shutdown protein TraB
MDAFEPSRATSFGDDVRETHMADRLAEFRDDGDVVAVVGRHHLDSVAEQLDALLGEADRCPDC